MACYLWTSVSSRSTKKKFISMFVILVVLFIWWRLKIYNLKYIRNTNNKNSAFTEVNNDASAREKYHIAALEAEAVLKKSASLIIPGLGEGGQASKFDSHEENTEAERVMKIEAFNKLLSDCISLDRSLNDFRHPLCRRDWDTEKDLPDASVVIVFHNEPRSTLLRTVHSVVRRSPRHLLHEVLLIDDFSNRDELEFELDYYLNITFHRVVRRIKLSRRWGIARARVLGAFAAKGQVLVFLDAHCEVTDQWLEPLLAHVRDNRQSIAVPMIDIINATTLAYESRDNENFTVGGFSWDGHYKWIHVPPREKLRRLSGANATITPVMAGGLFAMDRKYFWKVGSYDERMDLWGGENLEISFRVWMCGGSIMIIPCSRVGHIFREFSPYLILKDSHGINTLRLANVWMDDYKRLFIMNRPDLINEDCGNLESRIEIRNNLKCHSFKWYLENIYPEKFITDENVQAYGKVRPRMFSPSVCLESNKRIHPNSTIKNYLFYLVTSYCRHKYDADTNTQIYSLTLHGEFRWDDKCAELYNSSQIVFKDCNSYDINQQWEYTNSMQLWHKLSGLCMNVVEDGYHKDVLAVKCQNNNRHQIWTFENSFLLKH